MSLGDSLVGKPVLASANDAWEFDYGSVEAEAKPKMLTEYETAQASKLMRGLIGLYLFFFTVFLFADIIYYATVDARFPEGLNHLYSSEWERQQSILYTRQTLVCSICGRISFCCFVMGVFYFELFLKVEVWLCELWAFVANTWEPTGLAACVDPCLMPFFSCLEGCYTCCCCYKAPRSARELLHGSFYLMLFALSIEMLQAPFTYWRSTIDLNFGFANALTVSHASVMQALTKSICETLIFGVLSNFVFLAILQYRAGWFVMWLMISMVTWVAMSSPRTVLELAMPEHKVLPKSKFAVGRGFDLLHSSSQKHPWVSANRLYYNASKTSKQEALEFQTDDESKGKLMLGLHESSGNWVITERGESDKPEVLAKVKALSLHKKTDEMLAGLDGEMWPGGHGQIGIRDGERLRQKLFYFAKQRHIDISQVYLIDGSHKDARANAFVMGSDNAVIGLYDTLFLGGHKEESAEDGLKDEDDVKLVGAAPMSFISRVVKGIGVEDEVRKGEWNSAPTQAMTDDEIIAIIAHELGHSALGHTGEGMWVQFASNFMKWAAMGWAAHSALLVAPLGLMSPVLHIGFNLHEFLVGPSVAKTLKFFTDWHTRSNEYAADAYAAELSETYAGALQTGLAKLSVNSNQDPDMPSWYEVLHTDHPTTANRWSAIESVKQRTKYALASKTK